LALLAFPWAVHAFVVTLSAFGAHPLSGRLSATLVLVSSVAAAWVVARRAAPERRQDDVGRSGPLPAPAGILTNGLAVAACIAFAIALLASVLLPIVAYDAIAYRLPTIASWLDVGRIAWVPTDDPVRNGYPMGQESVSAVFAAATGSLRFAAATSFAHVAA